MHPWVNDDFPKILTQLIFLHFIYLGQDKQKGTLRTIHTHDANNTKLQIVAVTLIRQLRALGAGAL